MRIRAHSSVELALAACLAATPAAAQKIVQSNNYFPAGQPSVRMGQEIASDGSTLVASAPNESYANNRDGVVYVFDLASGSMAPSARLLPGISGGENEFGTAVDVDGDLIVGTAPGYDGAVAQSGVVVTAQRSGTTWQIEPVRLEAPTPLTGDLFGSSIALDAPWLVVGARGGRYRRHQCRGRLRL